MSKKSAKKRSRPSSKKRSKPSSKKRSGSSKIKSSPRKRVVGKKKSSSKPAKKKTARKAAKAKVVSFTRASSSTISSPPKVATVKRSKVSKIVRSIFPPDEFEQGLEWVLQADSNEVRFALYLVVSGRVENLFSHPIDEISDIVRSETDSLDQIEKMEVLADVNDFVTQLSNGPEDLCEILKVCDFLDLNKMKSISQKAIRDFEKKIGPVATLGKWLVISPLVSEMGETAVKLWGGKMAYSAIVAAEPATLISLLLAVLIVTGTWQVCECGKAS